MKRKFTFLLMALLALAGFKSWGQEQKTLTVYEGTDFNQYVPFYGNYADAFTKSNMIMSASNLAQMAGGTISSMKFYLYQDNWGNIYSGNSTSNWQVYLKEVTESVTTGPIDVTTATKVYDGTIDFTGSQGLEVVINFTPSFTYNGGNLLIAIQNTTKGTYPNVAFLGNGNASGYDCSGSSYSYSSLGEITSWGSYTGSYLPKTTFTYTGGAALFNVNLIQPEDGEISASPSQTVAGATVTLTATPNHGYEFSEWSTTPEVEIVNNQFIMPDYDVTVSATFTAQQSYTVYITYPTDDGNTTATLSATPSTGVFEGDEVRLSYSDLAEGYKFVNYVATNVSTSGPIAVQQKWDNVNYVNYNYFTMPDADVNLTANVKLIHTIYVAEMQHGRLSVNPNSQYDQITAGETITISPTPDYGYALESLTITKVSGGTITPVEQEQGEQIIYTFEMPEDDVNIAATFASTGTLYTVTLPEETEMGSVNASRIENFEDDEVTLTVYAKTGYYLESIVVKKNSDQTVVVFTNQETSYSYTYCYFNMPADDVTVTATFGSYPRYTLTLPQASAAGNITSSQSDLTNILANTTVYLYVYPSDGFVLENLTVKKDSDQSDVYIIDHWYDSYYNYYTYYFNMPEGNVTVNATFNELPHTLTVFPNTTTNNQYIPFNGFYTDVQKSKSQFIIPKAELQEMKDGKIINLTLYTNFNKSFTGTWNIYVMEVADGTTLSSSYVSLDGVDPVYFGNLTASSNELSVEITPYPYQGGNLLVCFDQTSTGNYSSQGSVFYGVNASYGASRYTYYSNQTSSSFLPKTTFTYTPAVKYNIAIDEEMENGTVLASAESAAAGETITLTPQPEAGYGFTAWNVTTATGSVTVNDNNQFTMPASDVTVSARFGLLDRYAVVVSQPTEGAVLSVNPTSDYYEGLEVRLNCELTEGYQFGEWIVTNQGTSTSVEVLHNYSPESYDYFVMPAANVNVTATINKVYAISIAPTENGKIYTYPENNAAVGTQVEVYAYPADGYYLESLIITDQSGEVEHDAYNRFIMTASDVTVTATFSNAHYSITLNEPENGTLTANVEDLTDVFPTSLITITATPATHYHLLSLTIMANGQEVPVVSQWENNYVIQMPASNVEVTATFEEDYKYDVSLDYNEEGGYITLQGGNIEYYAGDDVYVYFTPETGYILYSLEAEESDQTPVTMTKYSAFYKFIMPENDVTVTAEFVRGITVNDGTTTNYYVPFEGDGAHYGYTESQFIIPETTLTALKGNDITGMVYYLASPQNQNFDGSWDVYIKNNMSSTTLSGLLNLTEMDEKVYSGNMVVADGKMTVTFNEAVPYYYGNLLICFNQTAITSTANVNTSWYGITATNAAYSCYTEYVSTPVSRSFLPKVTFLYEEGEPLAEYNITFHSNGIVRKQTLTEGQSLPNPTNIPAGLTFAGWATEDIEIYYNEEQAEQIEYVTAAHAEEDLYAVFSYSETETTSKGAGTWTKVTDVNELANNDKVVFVYGNLILGQRTGEYNYYFSALSNGLTIVDNVVTNIPDDAVEFTLQSNGDNWHLNYYDKIADVMTCVAYGDYDVYPASYGWGFSDWTAEQISDAVVFKTSNDTHYIGYNAGAMKVVNSSGNKCNVYKAGAPVVTKTYYMTEVLTSGNITADTELKNIIITTGTVTVNEGVVLTMNENGLFRNKNAANFVFGYGAQLITDNTGVLATMKKHINNYNYGWYTISSPLAESTEFTNVTNLIPTTVTATDYDLYRLNEAAFRWENARPETDQEPTFTTIDKGVGYIYSNNAGADYIAFAGEINVEDVECTLTKDAGHGFNLIGNPFMQNIELANVTGVTLADGFYVLNNDNTWGTEPMTGEIKPLQGFLVQATAGGAATISKPASTSKGERSNEHNTNIEMIVSNSNHRDNAYAVFGEGTGLNKINHRNAEAPMLYIPQDGENFAIAFMNENTTLFPLNFKAMTTGKYSISLKATDDINTLVLVDNMTGVETNMLLESSYSFIGSPADRENRFTVKLGISHNDNNENEQFVYQYGNELIINGEGMLQVFDVLGRVVISEEVHGQRVNIGNLVKGTYIVRMTGENVMTQKIIVK